MENVKSFKIDSTNAIREAKTTVDIRPTDVNVILKIVYRAKSAGVLLSDKTDIKDLVEPVSMVVAGYGEATYGFELGDHVITNAHAQGGQPLYVKDNKTSMTNFIARAKGLVGANGSPIVKDELITEYVLVSAYDIVAIDYTEDDIAEVIC